MKTNILGLPVKESELNIKGAEAAIISSYFLTMDTDRSSLSRYLTSVDQLIGARIWLFDDQYRLVAASEPTPAEVDNEQLESLLTTITNQDEEIEMRDKEITRLQAKIEKIEKEVVKLRGEKPAAAAKKPAAKKAPAAKKPAAAKKTAAKKDEAKPE